MVSGSVSQFTDKIGIANFTVGYLAVPQLTSDVTLSTADSANTIFLLDSDSIGPWTLTLSRPPALGTVIFVLSTVGYQINIAFSSGSSVSIGGGGGPDGALICGDGTNAVRMLYPTTVIP